ncbi:MAG: SprB repeat-containing protein, partial [Fluviicola sp.]|nr:SprB repeat-containing protein [Fluviicola sp.]
MLKYFTIFLLFSLFIAPSKFFGQNFNCNYVSSGGNPETPTPVIPVDLSANPSAIQTISIDIPSNGYGQCCGYADNFNCVTLQVIVNPNSGGVLFNLAGANGNTYIRLNDCNATAYDAGHTFCPSGPGPHYFSFCRTGSTDYSITVTSVPAPTGAGNIITADGCTDQLSVIGLTTSSITWSSIVQNGQGANYYNNYLSNLSGGQVGVSGVLYDQDVSSVLVTPQPGYPNTITYQVCGNPIINSYCPSAAPTNWCSTSSVSIYPTLFANAGPDVAICVGGSATTFGSAIGGTFPYVYTWRNSSGTIVYTTTSNNDTVPVTFNVVGDYTLTVSDATGCPVASDVVNVSSFVFVPTANAGSDITVCRSPTPSVQINGSVTQTNTGLWSGGNGTYNSSTSDLSLTYTPSAAEISSGIVTLTLTPTNTKGCPYVADNVTINLPQFTSSLSVNPTNISCNGLTNGSIDLNISTGTPSYSTSSILWSNAAITEDLSGLGVNNYTATVTDINGCAGSISSSITQPAILTSSISSQTNVSCYGGNNGTFTVVASGGTSNYLYSLNGGANQSNGVFSNLIAGSYTVLITDANNCSVSQIVTITQPTAPVVLSATQVDVLCYGGTTGSIDLGVTGGTGAYSYNWSNSSTTQDLSGLAAGTYTVIV